MDQREKNTAFFDRHVRTGHGFPSPGYVPAAKPKPHCIICKKQIPDGYLPVCSRPLCNSVWEMVGASIEDCRNQVRKCEDIEILASAVAYELLTKKRATIVRMISARLICLRGRRQEQALAQVCSEEEAVRIAKSYGKGGKNIPKINPGIFIWEKYIGVVSYPQTSDYGLRGVFKSREGNKFIDPDQFSQHIEVLGWCNAMELLVRPGHGDIAVMLRDKDTGEEFWMHMDFDSFKDASGIDLQKEDYQ